MISLRFFASVDTVVDGPVENSLRRGITPGRDVDRRVDKKIIEIAGRNLLCWTCGGSRNLLSPETGTGRGRLRQRRKNRETGLFRRVSGPGGRLTSVRGRAIGRSAWQNRAGPLHLMHGGARHLYAQFGLANPAGVIFESDVFGLFLARLNLQPSRSAAGAPKTFGQQPAETFPTTHLRPARPRRRRGPVRGNRVRGRNGARARR